MVIIVADGMPPAGHGPITTIAPGPCGAVFPQPPSVVDVIDTSPGPGDVTCSVITPPATTAGSGLNWQDRGVGGRTVHGPVASDCGGRRLDWAGAAARADGAARALSSIAAASAASSHR